MGKCSICGEELSSFDRKHLKTKHPEYYREARRWYYASYLVVFSFCVVAFVLLYFRNELSENYVNIIILSFLSVELVFAVYIFHKLRRLENRYRKST